MPLMLQGVYIDTREKAYEAESCYYLDFQIFSALVSIEYINKENPDLSMFENRYQYYHFYVDHVLYSMGQICNRFIISRKDTAEIKERKQKNRGNFQFSEDIFPILSNKSARNTIEHIDEYNQKVIEQERGVGGFNLIDEHIDSHLAKELKERWKTHPYTLDLIDKEIWITRNQIPIKISLVELKEELFSLKKNVLSFRETVDFGV